MTAADGGDWIAVDWGTTNMRAALVGADGTVRARAADGPGMAALDGEAARFETALLAAVGVWLDDGADAPLDVLVCGMAGARQGWVEAPYRDVPAALDGLLDAAVPAPTAEERLSVRIVPGLCRRGDRPDVMRGEETQLLGLLAREGVADALVCLPGTHSKWATVTGGRVVDFATHLTGELFALLSERSILRHSLPAGGIAADRDADAADRDADAFDRGVEDALARPDMVLASLFALRAADLLTGPAPARAAARLSGLLIGAEVAVAAVAGRGVHIVGGRVRSRYARAIRIAGGHPLGHDGGDLAVAGLAAMRQGAR